jgi:hypothetical protein
MIKSFRLIGFLALTLWNTCSYGQIEITLRKSFIDSLKNRVTLSLDYQIVKAHEKPNPAAKDGDLHIAGIGLKVGLPMVAEIMNAREYPAALQIVHGLEGAGTTIRITGAWRIWCEHAAKGEQQYQGGHFPEIINSNPSHVFEIHPLIKIGLLDLISSLHPISGFIYKDADEAFAKYSNAKCKIEPESRMVKITTYGVGYNYAEFRIGILDTKQNVVEDGRFIFCRVMDKEGKIICERMRMAFPKNSDAENKVSTLNRGDVLHVVGIPRINLSEISDRVTYSATNPGMLDLNLPVEMIIVAVLK